MANWEGKPTLASVLKGYTPPTESALADPIKEHLRTLPAQLATNQAALDNAIASWNQTDFATGKPNPNYRPEAIAELTQLMPNVMGSTNAIKSLPDDWNKLSTMATEAYEALRKNPNKETHDYYKMIMEAKENAPLNNPKNVVAPVVKAEESYKGQHQAPMMDSGKPLHDLTDVYPEDFYSHKATQYYGTGSDRDAYVIGQLQSLRNRPNAEVWMYRAVPKNAESVINKGDWVTIDRQYAKEHGESALNGDYKIIKRKATARDLFTNGDSPFEMGYDPQPKVNRKELIEKQVKDLKD